MKTLERIKRKIEDALKEIDSYTTTDHIKRSNFNIDGNYMQTYSIPSNIILKGVKIK